VIHHKFDTETHVYFYENEFYPLSNFSAFRLKWKGLDFDTSEHAYHWEKFVSPSRHEALLAIQQQIMQARSAHEAFKIAERYGQLRRADWLTIRLDTMRSILQAKVEQHEYVRRKLLETGDRLLIEDSWRDAYWGWGQHEDGANMLGKLWMEIRTELRKEE